VTGEPIVAWRRAAKSGPRTPLVLLLHGRGADEYDLLGVADRLPLAFNYASVRAPVPVAGGGFTWFENHGAGRPVARSLESSIRSLRAWLDGPAIAPVSGRCYPFGFSAGMMMAGALLLDDPKRFSGAVLLSGALALRDAGSLPARRLVDVPVFYGRGLRDDVIPTELVVQTDAYLHHKSGALLTARRYDHAHSLSNRELADIKAWFDERE